MGNDGGSYQNCRKDIVKEKPKEIKIDQNIIARNKQKLCTLTQQPLRRPIAVCRLGNLYNYEDVLRALQDKTLSKQKFIHIKSFKDVKKINTKESQNSDQNSLIVCQITSQEFNGLTRFVVIFSCGCVMSEKAFNAGQNKNTKNNKESKNICLVCNQPFKDNDVISLNMTPEEQQEAQEKLILSNREKKQQKLEEKQKNKLKKQEISNNIKQEDSQQLNPDEEQKINFSKKSLSHQNTEIEQQKKVKKIKKSLIQQDSVTNNNSIQQINTDVPQSLMDKIASGEKIEKQPQDSQIYKSLFHKEHKVEDANALMFRNVRHGVR